jgi:DNA modification methylase
MCGDSTDAGSVAILMDGQKADMVFTDPPYGMNAVSKSGVLSKTYKTDIMNDDDNSVAIKTFELCTDLFTDSKQVWWGANYYTECLPSAECWIVWDKNNGESDQTDCELAWTNFRSVVRQFTLSSEKTNRVHPTRKPVKLIYDIFNKFDYRNEINKVVDLFGGSGSTLIACEQLGRKCYMMELDPKYCDVIRKRYWKFKTGSEEGWQDGTKAIL